MSAETVAEVTTLNRLRSLIGVVRNGLRIEPEHFSASLDRRRAVQLFSSFVEQIEIETTSFCNRTCSFCPNSFIDRRSERNAMPEATWTAIVAGLREVDFAGTVVWSRYSEPLSERRILERIREVRAAAPKCRIALNTNGDYLDESYLDALRDAGADRVMVDLYIPDDAPTSVEFAAAWHERFLQRVGRRATILFEEPEFVGRLEDPMEIVTRVRNSRSLQSIQVSDRGGLLEIGKVKARLSPCFLPFKQLVVDWDGSVVPCCQIRSDAGAHARCVVGRIGETTGLVEAYALLADWRAALIDYTPKKGPCATCSYSAYSTDWFTRTAAALARDPRSLARSVARLIVLPALGRRSIW